MPEGSNPLVAAAPQDGDGPGPLTSGNGDYGYATGIGIAESAMDAFNGISDGNWVEGGLGVLGLAAEAASAAIDPFGWLMSSVASFLMEHVQPLKDMLDSVAGDPPVIQSYSETWGNVAKSLEETHVNFTNSVKNGTTSWQGEAADSYRESASEQAEAISGAATVSGAISTVTMIMGEVVAFVRETVRDLIADLVGKLISWVLETVFSLGFGTPVVVAQAVTAISKWATKIADLLQKLCDTIRRVSPLLGKLADVFVKIIKVFGKIAGKITGLDVISTKNITPGGFLQHGGSNVDTPGGSSGSGADGDSGSGSDSGSDSSGSDSDSSSDSGSDGDSSSDGSAGDPSSAGDGPADPSGDGGDATTATDRPDPSSRSRPGGDDGSTSPDGSATPSMHDGGSSPSADGSPDGSAARTSSPGSTAPDGPGQSTSTPADSSTAESPTDGSTPYPDSGGDSPPSHSPSRSESTGPDSDAGNGPPPQRGASDPAGPAGDSPSANPDSRHGGDSPSANPGAQHGGDPTGAGPHTGGGTPPPFDAEPDTTSSSGSAPPASPPRADQPAASQVPSQRGEPGQGGNPSHNPQQSRPTGGGAIPPGGAPGGPSGGAPAASSGSRPGSGSGWTGTPGSPGASASRPSDPASGPGSRPPGGPPSDPGSQQPSGPSPQRGNTTSSSAVPQASPNTPPTGFGPSGTPHSPATSHPQGTPAPFPSGPGTPHAPVSRGPGAPAPTAPATRDPGAQPPQQPGPHRQPDRGRPDQPAPERPASNGPAGPDRRPQDAPDPTTDRGGEPAHSGDRPSPDEVNQRHSESTPAGTSFHRDDPEMGDLPHRVQPDPDGRYTADVHVTPDGHARIGGRDYTPEEFADILRRNGDYDGGPVRLIGCDAGSNDFARRLSNELDTEVMAPNKPAWTDSNGRVFSSDYEIGPDGKMRPKIPPNGEWDTHHPDGSSSSASDDAFTPDTAEADKNDLDPDDASARGRDFPSPQETPWREPTYHRSEDVTVRPDERFYDPANPRQLEPMTRYNVTDSNGRSSTIYTDDTLPTPRITHVDAEVPNTRVGTDPDHPVGNPDANHLLPDTDYRITSNDGVFEFSTADSETPRPNLDLDNFDAPHRNSPAPDSPIRNWNPDSAADGPFSNRPRETLEPNSTYEVYDHNGDWHGTFYTDDAQPPKFTHIETRPDEGRWVNPETGDKNTMHDAHAGRPEGLPLRGVKYKIGDMVYHADAHGNSAVSFEPDYSSPSTIKRGPTQTRIGHIEQTEHPQSEGRGGHGADHASGAGQGRLAITPQPKSQNNLVGDEDNWAQAETDRRTLENNRGADHGRVRIWYDEPSATWTDTLDDGTRVTRQTETPDRTHVLTEQVAPDGTVTHHYRSFINVPNPAPRPQPTNP